MRLGSTISNFFFSRLDDAAEATMDIETVRPKASLPSAMANNNNNKRELPAASSIAATPSNLSAAPSLSTTSSSMFASSESFSKKPTLKKQQKPGAWAFSSSIVFSPSHTVDPDRARPINVRCSSFTIADPIVPLGQLATIAVSLCDANGLPLKVILNDCHFIGACLNH